MGKHANSAAYREFERLDRQRQEESLSDESPLTPEELEQIASDSYWNRLDATADELAEARRGMRFVLVTLNCGTRRGGRHE